VAWTVVETGGDATSPGRRQWRAAERVHARGALYRQAREECDLHLEARG
jgi:hypothetical protein